MKAYLAGAIERAKDPFTWRQELGEFLKEQGVDVFDPCAEEHKKLRGYRCGQLPEGYEHWHQFKNATELHLRKRFAKYMDRVQKVDLEAIEGCDWLIVRWCYFTQMGGGTHHELVHAYNQGRIILVVEDYEIPAWYYRLVEKSGGTVFKNMTELKDYIKEELEDK